MDSYGHKGINNATTIRGFSTPFKQKRLLTNAKTYKTTDGTRDRFPVVR